MKSTLVSLAAVVLAFTSVASAKTAKPANQSAVVAKAYPDREYASTGSFLAGSYGGQDNEFLTNLTTGYFTSEKRCKDCSTGSTIAIGVSYLHYLKDGWQVGGEGDLRVLSKENSGTGDSETLIDVAVIGAYNFQSDIKNAFFAKAGLGLYSMLKDDQKGYENKFGFFLGGGKRFALWNNVTYTPELRLVKKGDIDMGIEIAFLNFSVIW